MKENLSYIEKLELQIDEFVKVTNDMLDNSSIFHKRINRDPDYIVIGVHPFSWSKKDEKNQIKAKNLYEKFNNNFELLRVQANPTLLKKIQKSDKWIENIIDQNKAPGSIQSAKSNLLANVNVYKQFLSYFKVENKSVFIIPDTNSIIQFPEPKSYRKITEKNNFNFIILPTVLSELDKLKMTHRSDDFRKKVSSVIKRLKGFRKQGNILDGVIVDKSILVKMIATEPKFDKTLNWLDSKNNDDRIVANALELQVSYPGDKVVLITSDINLQNKAELANLTVFDTDDLE